MRAQKLIHVPTARTFSHLRHVLTVLVEEEESIRNSWTRFFSEQGMRLLTFGSAESFLAEFEADGSPVEFFFDQDFGLKRGVGMELAKVVWNWPGRTNTSLVTAYPPEMFMDELESGLLDFVLPKFPDQIFGPGYFDKHIARRIEAEGFENFLSGSFGKITEAFERLDKVMTESALTGHKGAGA